MGLHNPFISAIKIPLSMINAEIPTKLEDNNEELSSNIISVASILPASNTTHCCRRICQVCYLFLTDESPICHVAAGSPGALCTISASCDIIVTTLITGAFERYGILCFIGFSILMLKIHMSANLHRWKGVILELGTSDIQSVSWIIIPLQTYLLL